METYETVVDLALMFDCWFSPAMYDASSPKELKLPSRSNVHGLLLRLL